MRTELEGDLTPEELCQTIMETVMKNAELITMKTGEDDGIEKIIFPKAKRRTQARAPFKTEIRSAELNI